MSDFEPDSPRKDSPRRAKVRTSDSISPPRSAQRGPSNSPPKSGRSKKSNDKTPSPSRSKKSASSDQSTKSAKKKRTVTMKVSDLTESGLKKRVFTGEGLTVIPVSLLHESNLGELYLNNNNLRTLPPDIKRWKNLQKLDISKNGIRCARPNDFSGLPMEMKELTHLEDLNISECNLPYIPPVIWRLTSLKVLDISRNKINMLPSEIGNLGNLITLNLKHTNLATLPPEIAYCQDLEEIQMWGNEIETLPETLPEMPKLHTLAFDYRHFCKLVDQTYMENYLSTGQIKSKHIPMVVFELPALRSLDLENTKVNNLMEIYNISLREFNLSHNFIQTLPMSLYTLNHLVFMDLSYNQIATLPDELGNVKSLIKLRVNNNKLQHIPSTLGQLHNLLELDLGSNQLQTLPPSIRYLQTLKSLVICENKLTSLPDEICELSGLETLDATDNSIAVLPMKLHQLKGLTCAHSYDKFRKCGLWLYNNPLVQPPPEVWRTEKPAKIFEYLKKLAITKTENLQRQKMLVLGESQCGKTDFVWGLVQGKSLMAEKEREKIRKKLTKLKEEKKEKEKMKSKKVLKEIKEIKDKMDQGGTQKEKADKIMEINHDGKTLVRINEDVDEKDVEIHDHLDDFTTVKKTTEEVSEDEPVIQNGEIEVNLNKTRFIEQTVWRTENSVEFVINDFGGDPTYKMCYPIFLDSKSLVVIMYDHSAYTSDSHYEMVGQWLDLLNVHTPGAVVKLVGTKADLCESDEMKEATCDIVQSEVKKQQKRHLENLHEQLTKIQTEIQTLQSEIGQNMSNDHMQHLESEKNKLEGLIKHSVKVDGEVCVISSVEGLPGVSSLINQIELMAIDTDLFPHAQRRIPDHWNKFKVKLKQEKSYYLRLKEVKDMALTFDIKGENLEECLMYLHDIGEVLWFHDIPGMSLILFHKPRLLVDFITTIYRHDFQIFFNYHRNKVFMSKGNFDRKHFEASVEIFLNHGQVSRPMLNCFWFYHQLDYEQFHDILVLMPLLDICYSVPEPPVPLGSNACTPLLVLPWYSQKWAGQDLENHWQDMLPQGTKVMSFAYEFQGQLTDGTFERISAALQDVVITRADWRDAILCTTENDKILLRLGSDNKTESDILSVTVKGNDSDGLESIVKDLTQCITDVVTRIRGLSWKIRAQGHMWDKHIICYTRRPKSKFIKT
ncbi:malignant fibrous histiocytoma-amplified sequence 1 homolog isoform X2 [Mizuhopecten yessoensis]|uniref:malignant fibrous histiocytoma-amplified sequence 1 homolog isoform X2 n=1 Tax=Mizuhopecten yessoensis TaxID=6573 RepID=UPI000B45E0F8|nr:malignant fibrous histiocytoma-amplified sequence 1 homolog isoform X2 [Mizuhopecten yessoensis]